METITILLIWGGLLGVYGAREFEDEQEQIVDTLDAIQDFDSSGDEIYKEFLPGEHRIKRTRVDSFGYQTEPIEGYMIESVCLRWPSNKNVITYVNTLPVVVLGDLHKDGAVTFDQFGQVVTKDSVKTIGSK